MKGCKWLLSQNHRVRNDFFGYRWYEAVAKHIKLFITNIKVERSQSWIIMYYFVLQLKVNTDE